MIRFVDLRPADIIGARFAYWDTIRGRFVEILGVHGWETWQEFVGDVRITGLSLDLDRFRRLTPDWAHDPATDAWP